MKPNISQWFGCAVVWERLCLLTVCSINHHVQDKPQKPTGPCVHLWVFVMRTSVMALFPGHCAGRCPAGVESLRKSCSADALCVTGNQELAWWSSRSDSWQVVFVWFAFVPPHWWLGCDADHYSCPVHKASRILKCHQAEEEPKH